MNPRFTYLDATTNGNFEEATRYKQFRFKSIVTPDGEVGETQVQIQNPTPQTAKLRLKTMTMTVLSLPCIGWCLLLALQTFIRPFAAGGVGARARGPHGRPSQLSPRPRSP